MSDLLAQIRRDIKTRMNELAPVVREAELLERRLAQLDGEQLEGGRQRFIRTPPAASAPPDCAGSRR